MNKAKSILKQWLEFADGIGLEFKQAQQMAIEHCEQNNDYKTAKQIKALKLEDVWEGHESDVIYNIIVSLRKGEIKAFKPQFKLESDCFRHVEKDVVEGEYTTDATFQFDEINKEFALVEFRVKIDGNWELATNAQIDALSKLLYLPEREYYEY